MEYDDKLVAAAAEDRDALGQLYELYHDPIYRYCRHRLFTREAAEDVVSAVFLGVAEGIRDFRGTTHGKFRCWLYSIATNKVAQYVRTSKRRRRLLEAAVACGTLSTASGDSDNGRPDWSTVYQAVWRLKPREQGIVTLRFFEGLPTNEIAEIMNCKPGTIRVALLRATRRLKDHLGAAGIKANSR